MKVKIVGLGYVGQTLAVVMADAGYIVHGVEKNREITESIKSGASHIHEVGLNTLIKKHLGKTLFVGDWDDFDGSEDAIIVCVPSPVDKKTKKPNIEIVKDAIARIGKTLRKGQIIILRSTVPIGTTSKTVRGILEKTGLKAGKDFHLVYAPERTIQGAAIAELRNLPQIIGGIDEKSTEIAINIFRKVTSTIIQVSSTEAAEAIKLVDNSFRDVKFGYANELACFCEKSGLNAIEIIRAANQGYTRNTIPYPSPGVGGGCLIKDPYIFLDCAASVGANLNVIKSARHANESMPKRIIDRLANELNGKKVFIGGFAFKGHPETNDVRESPTLDLLSHLRQTDAAIVGYDPVVEGWKIKELGVEHSPNLEQAIQGVDIAIFMTNHREFANISTIDVFSKMKSGGIVVDGWGLFDKKEIESLGLRYMGVGISD